MISEVSDLQRWTVSWTGPFPKAAMFRPHSDGAKNAPAGGPYVMRPVPGRTNAVRR
jgi:hypothetical protein